MISRTGIVAGLVLLGAAWVTSYRLAPVPMNEQLEFAGRSEVLFWHFWGGADRDVVDQVVAKFNQSQSQYFVRAIPMPGNNLQAKLFLAIAGGDPPDLVNQDDPIVGDWGWRGAIQAIDSICDEAEVAAIQSHLFPAARKLGSFDGKLYGVCNGLDIRALYYNKTMLQEHGLPIPATLEQLDEIAKTICPVGTGEPKTFGYLPDSRRLWAWGYVFGGDFYDDHSKAVLMQSQAIQRAASWMQRYSDWYGPDTINRFRQGDQSLPGKSFPLLPLTDESSRGRYAVVMDGQWRVRDINAFTKRRKQTGIAAPEFGVCPLPVPAVGQGRSDAGWVNGNFFVVPKGAKNPQGAVAFMKFWIGMTDIELAANTCIEGGWIPVSPQVVRHPVFHDYLQHQPLFAEFVRLAASHNQFPIPVIPGAPLFKRMVERVAVQIMNDPTASIDELLETTQQSIQEQLSRFDF